MGYDLWRRLGGLHPAACTCVNCQKGWTINRGREPGTPLEILERQAQERRLLRKASKPKRPPPLKKRGAVASWAFPLLIVAGIAIVVLWSSGILERTWSKATSWAEDLVAEVAEDPGSGSPTVLYATPERPSANAQRQPAPTPAPKFPGDAPLDTASVEEWIIDFTNRERIKAGLRPFDHDPAISDIGRAHSEQMTLHGYGHVVLGKDPTDRALAAGYDCRAYHEDGSYSYGLSENIAKYPRVKEWMQERGLLRTKVYPTIFDADAKEAALGLVQGWMDSPGHRANIMDQDARRIGVGVAVELSEKYDGWPAETFYATQNFSSCK